MRARPWALGSLAASLVLAGLAAGRPAPAAPAPLMIGGRVIRVAADTAWIATTVPPPCGGARFCPLARLPVAAPRVWAVPLADAAVFTPAGPANPTAVQPGVWAVAYGLPAPPPGLVALWPAPVFRLDALGVYVWRAAPLTGPEPLGRFAARSQNQIRCRARGSCRRS